MKGRQPIHEVVLEPEGLAGPACIHVWIIDAPAGPLSKGICRICREQRNFHNYIEGSYWGSDVSLEQLSGASRFGTAVEIRPEQSGSGIAEDE